MKIVVTGGAGFIGSHFVRFMLDLGHFVTTIDTLTYAGNLENLGEYRLHPRHIFYKEDICNYDAIEKIIFDSNPDVIVHMAAESHVDRSIDCADDFIKTNIAGTYSLLRASLAYYKTVQSFSEFRFLHISTDEVFGALGLQGTFNETMAYRPNSPYAASKASADHLVRSYYKTYGLPIMIAHPSNNYGPNQYPEKLIPLTILNALEGRELPVYGDGQQIRDWLFVEDNVRALYALIKQGRIGESYCIGSSNEISNITLVHKIADILDCMCLRGVVGSYKKLITFVADRPGHDFRYASDCSKLKEHTGWAPQVTFQEGLQKTVEWYVSRYFQGSEKKSEKRVRLGLG